jgi:tetratricopeptide (TPR) repeat protein
MLGMVSLDHIQSQIIKAKEGKRGSFHLLLFALCLLLLLSACSRRALLDQAQAAWDGGDYAIAAERYERFLRDNPQSEKAAFARFRVAMICYRDLKLYDRAIQHYIQFIEDFPKSPDLFQARLRLAECYDQTGKRSEAINEYEMALPFASGEKERRRVRLNMGELYYQMDDLGQALVEYQKAAGNSGYDDLTERASLRLGGIRYLRSEYRDALAAYEAVAVKTKDPMIRRIARLAMADCYERMSQYDLAVNLLETTEPDPKSPDYIQQRIASIRELQRQRNLAVPSPFRLRNKRIR